MTMCLLIKLISTDLDGTLFAEFESPPIPASVQQRIGASCKSAAPAG